MQIQNRRHHAEENCCCYINVVVAVVADEAFLLLLTVRDSSHLSRNRNSPRQPYSIHIYTLLLLSGGDMSCPTHNTNTLTCHWSVRQTEPKGLPRKSRNDPIYGSYRIVPSTHYYTIPHTQFHQRYILYPTIPPLKSRYLLSAYMFASFALCLFLSLQHVSISDIHIMED